MSNWRQWERFSLGCEVQYINISRNQIYLLADLFQKNFIFRRGELLRRVKLIAGASPPPVTNIVIVSELCIVCTVGHDLHIVKFPSVMEKNE